MLLGLLLYFWLSPITTAALHDFGGAMANSGMRFWAVEHLVGMILGIALAHIGRGRLKRMTDDAKRHRTIAISFTLALLIILASIPWPGSPNGRPLLRW
jgi:peptidoglycan/LPS O-acetylase OafA/YrhL